MASATSVIGQSKAWSLLKKLGEGDAGEVFLVESILDRKIAILKRPRRSSLASEIIRQATQIESEGRILRSLDGLIITYPKSTTHPILQIGVPNLLDQSPAGSEFSDRFFIVVEKASGVDLNTIGRCARLGAADPDGLFDEQETLLFSIIQAGIFPRLLLLRALVGTIALLEKTHRYTSFQNNVNTFGIIWNDVKPDHLFWDPICHHLTVIDWGNAQFLEQDGYNKERRLSRNDDYAQYIQTFSGFLADHDPELNASLKWPNPRAATQSFPDLIKPLKETLHQFLNQEFQILVEARQREIDILRAVDPLPEEHQQLLDIQQQIITFGEIPDYAGAENFCIKLAIRLTSEGRLDDFTKLSDLSCRIHSDNPLKWQILTRIAQIASQDGSAPGQLLLSALESGLKDDWPRALWNLLSITQNSPEPAWWNDLSSQIRQVGLGLDPALQPPLTTLRRTTFTLQAEIQKRQDETERSPTSEPDENIALVKLLKEEIIPNWSEVEPNPPDSSLEYTDIERIIPIIIDLLPTIQDTLIRFLEQPRAQVSWIMNAWKRRDFDSARLGLRRLLLWDPDRRRVLTADRAIVSTSAWLTAIHSGPKTDQVLLDFITHAELSGRELRSQVGPAEWLDSVLDSFSQLRKGRKPGELIVEKPDLLRELPWLDAFEPRKYVPTQPAKSIILEREKTSQLIEPLIRGFQECTFGSGQSMLLTDPLDTWAPEARGSSARAFTGFLPTHNDQLKQVAIKIIRNDRIEYGLPLFREETQILTILRDVPGITPLSECGFIQFTEHQQLPPDHSAQNARSLSGIAQRYNPDQVSTFMNILEEKTHQGWLPYLAMPKLDNQQNLMWICDSGYTHGNFLPIEESLRLAVQICDIIQVAHDRNIVYRDHKLLHYYWIDLYNGVFMIDWNVARFHPQGLSRAEIQFDLVQLGARALHHIFSGRVAPGALADGPNKVEEIETASSSYRVQWTYDDQRLPTNLKEILEQLLLGNYNSAARLRDDFLLVYAQLFTETIPNGTG